MVMIIIVSFSFTNKLYHIFFIFSNKNNWSGAADSNRHCMDFKSTVSAVGLPPDNNGVALVGNEVDPFYSVRQLPQLYYRR